MKNLTEAQLMGFRGAMVPPTRRKYHTDKELAAEPSKTAKAKTATRRAIEVYQEQRALQRELEL